MKMFDVFVKEAPNKVFIGLVSGVVTGVTFSLLIPLLMIALDAPPAELADQSPGQTGSFLSNISNTTLATVFFSTCIALIALRTFSQSIMASVASSATCSLRLKIYRRVNRAPIANIENIGASKLLSLITGDVPRIISGVQAIPDLLISLMSVVGILTFMAVINLQVFLFILAMIAFGIVTYHIPLLIGQRYFTESRPIFDKLHESIRGILFGAKELKLNDEKRDSFYKEDLQVLEEDIKSRELKGFILMQSANNYGDLVSFVIVGVVTFILSSYAAITQTQLVGVVMAMIYMISPIHSVLQCIPLISRGRVSLRRINWLFTNLEEERIGDVGEAKPQWSRMSLEKIEYSYKKQKGSSHGFSVGPIDLEINKGEVTFIVGGNGSGKSTLSKIITQHYIPDEGVIKFDGTTVTEANRRAFRHQTSAIYTDYYLFRRILGYNDLEVDSIVSGYLSELGLASKVKVSDGHFSTIQLSDGQKRRLALLAALLEDRELYLFDEWAADQDPTFKDIFYHHYLSQLKAENKAVVVITHDDRYFSVADKVVHMESGKISRIESQASESAEASGRANTGNASEGVYEAG